MIILSVMFHGLLFLCLVFSSFVWPRKPVFPLIHHVELVHLPQEHVQQPKVVSQEKPKPVEQKPKIEKSTSLKIKRETKVHKPVENKKPVMQEKVAPEKPPVPEEPMKTETDQVKEATNTVPGIPEIMPDLKKTYTEYSDYYKRIEYVIRGRWIPLATLTGQKMRAVVAFKISRTGKIEGDVTLEESSGNLFYDQAALRATMGNLPPPPSGYPEELLKMKLIYVLDQSRLN